MAQNDKTSGAPLLTPEQISEADEAAEHAARNSAAVQAAKAKAASTVKMAREEPTHDGGPTTADVHPDEVENMLAFGWAKA